MKTIEWETNIMCGSCIAKVTPTLNEEPVKGFAKLKSLIPKKILTVTNYNLNKNASD